MKKTLTEELEIAELLETVYDYSSKVIESKVIAFADMGLWNGRVMGYKSFPVSLSGIAGELSSFDGTPVSLEYGKDLKYSYAHHDGTNHVTIRRFKKNLSDFTIQKVYDAIYEQEDNAYELFMKHTVSIAKDFKNGVQEVW